MRVRRLAARRAVGDALAGEPVEASIGRCRQATPQARMIVRARRTSPPSRCTWRVGGVDPRDRPRDQDLGAEPPRLLQRAARQLVAGDAGREAEVVLDPRRGAGLAAGRLALDDDRAQALRGAVDGRGQAGGPGADDHRVVLGRGGLGREAEQLGDAAQLRADHGLAVDDADRRAVALGRQRPPHCSAASGTSGVSHLKRDLVAVEEVPQLGAGGVPAVADHDGARRRRLGGEALQAARRRRSGGSRARRPPRRRPGARPRSAW